MKLTFRPTYGLWLAACWLFPGCQTAPPSSIGKSYHEWSRIFSVETDGAKRDRRHVGYLDHVYSVEDPEGKYFVLDLAHERRGFVLPASGKAFVFERDANGELHSREVAQLGLEKGVKRILNLPGEVERQEITSASTAPPQPASKG